MTKVVFGWSVIIVSPETAPADKHGEWSSAMCQAGKAVQYPTDI